MIKTIFPKRRGRGEKPDKTISVTPKRLLLKGFENVGGYNGLWQYCSLSIDTDNSILIISPEPYKPEGVFKACKWWGNVKGDTRYITVELLNMIEEGDYIGEEKDSKIFVKVKLKPDSK
jgi:hypothetical protein